MLDYIRLLLFKLVAVMSELHLFNKLMNLKGYSMPEKYERGECVENHIALVDKFCAKMEYNEADIATVLLNTLGESESFEIFGCLEYNENRSNVEWLKAKLLSLFGEEKESKEEKIIRLYKIQQSGNQNIREFASTLRIEAYRIFKDKIDSKEREKYLVTAFMNGLNNCQLSLYLKSLKCDTLDRCVEACKSLEKSGKEKDLYKIQNQSTETDNSTIALLRAEIKNIQSQLSFVMKQLQEVCNIKSQDKTTTQNGGREPFRERKLNTPIKCFRCDKIGHMARSCPNSPFCPTCKMEGHSFRDCWNKNQPKKKVRQVYMEDDYSDNDSTASVEDYRNETQTNQSPKVCSIRNRSEIRPRSSKPVKFDKNVINWANYVEGNAAKPNKILHQKTYSSVCSNKPLINTVVGDRMIPTLLDTGAELNVIDVSLVQQFQQANIPHLFEERHYSLSCANNTSLKAFGKISLTVKIGTQDMKMVFTVVENLKPRMIIGIRQMKSEGMVIDTANDCLYLKDKSMVPFQKCISNPSIFRPNQGNGAHQQF